MELIPDLFCVVLCQPAIQSLLHELEGVLTCSTPVFGACDARLQESRANSGRRLFAIPKLLFERNSIKPGYRKPRANRHHVSGGNHPGGGDSRATERRCRQCWRELRTASAAFCQSTHRSNLIRGVCCC